MAAPTSPAGKRTDDGAALLRQVFGDSSDEESECRHGSEDTRFFQDASPFNPMLCEDPSWDRIKEIDGLWLCRRFLSPPQQQSLLSAIESEGWFADASHNQRERGLEAILEVIWRKTRKLSGLMFFHKRSGLYEPRIRMHDASHLLQQWLLLAMRFGDLPEWANQLSCSIRKAVLSADCLSELDTPTDEHKQGCSFSILPMELLGRDPLFDQLIVNLYHPGQGICAHVDLMRFADGIAIISLESPCIMHFSPLEDYVSTTRNPSEKPTTAVMRKIPVYLTPGSLVVMSGEARYLWKHEINRKPGFQMWEGREIDQERRISITLRKLCKEEG